MSKVLQRKLFRKKYVQGFQAGGIVTLKKGGEANYFEDVPAGRFLKSAGQSLVKEGKKAGAALYDLGAAPINLGMEFLTGSSPGYSGAKFFNVEGADPNKAYFMGVGTDATPKSLSEEKQKQAMRADTEVSGIEKQIQKDPSIRSELTKLTSDDVPNNQVAKVYTTGNKVIDQKFKEYEQKTFNKPVTPTKPKDETPADPSEVATKSQLRKIMDEIATERKEGYGVNVPLMKLALGLMKGTTTQPGLAGVAQIFGQAGEGALDAFLEQEKRKTDADMDLMELATKLKISQDEVAARKYAVDKQAELYGLKKFDPKAKEEAEASYDRVLTSYQGVNKILELLKNPEQISTINQISADLQGVAQSVFGYIPDKTPASTQMQQIITHLQLNLTDLLKDLKPVSKNELELLKRNIGELGYFKNPQDLKNKMNTLKVLLEKSLVRAQSSYDYNFSAPFGAGSIGGLGNRSGLTLDEHIKNKSSKKDEK